MATKIRLHLATADSALTVLSKLVTDALHADERRSIDSLIDRARQAIDNAERGLTDIESTITKAMREI